MLMLSGKYPQWILVNTECWVGRSLVISEMLCYFNAENIQQIFIKLNHTQHSKYCHHPRSSRFPLTWQSCYFFTLRICLPLLPRLTNHLVTCKHLCCIIGLGFGLLCQGWPVRPKRISFYLSPSLHCVGKTQHQILLNTELFSSVAISLYYFQYSYKSITCWRPLPPKHNKNKCFLSKRGLISRYLFFSWKTKHINISLLIWRNVNVFCWEDDDVL